MKLQNFRFNSAKDHTNGVFMINGRFQIYTIEDEHQTVKVYGETRVPDGVYPVRFRREGGFHERYKKKFPNMHAGMLEICNVPGFTFVLIHIGNDDDDTAGCLLTGSSNARGENWVGGSTGAYLKIYPPIRDALIRGEEVTIEFKTIDKPLEK